MSPAQEFACHMRYELPWMSRAIRDFHDELCRQSEEADQLASQIAECDEPDLAEALNELAARMKYASVYVAWLGRAEP